MRRIFTSVLTALAAVIVMAAPACAQSTPARPDRAPALELAFTYQGVVSDLVSGSHFWMQGGAAQIHGRVYGGWGVVADIAGAHSANIDSTGVGLDLITATFGPRYTRSLAHSRYSIYGQGLVGEAWGINSVFPGPSGATTTANNLAVEAGGGLNIDVTPRVAMRAFEADYLRTQLANSTGNVQNSLRVTAGIVLRFR